jgi:hypothetical protein
MMIEGVIFVDSIDEWRRLAEDDEEFGWWILMDSL